MPNILLPRHVATPLGVRSRMSGKGGIPRLLVVGGGIGGVTLCRKLMAEVKRHPALLDMTLFDPKDIYVFKPRLYEWLNGEDATLPMSWLFPLGGPVRFVQTRVNRISLPPGERFVQTEEGMYEYDYLVIATGATTSYFNVAGAPSQTLPLDNLSDIRNIKQRTVKKIQRAAGAAPGSEFRLENLSFEIIGGGATGIELAFELKYLVDQVIREDYPHLRGDQPLIQILEGSPEILPGFSAVERDQVVSRLKRADIELLCNHRVRRVERNRLVIDKRDPATNDFAEISIPSIDPIWVAGVRANLSDTLLPNVESYPGNGRIRVNQYLELPGHPDIYVIGDVAGMVDARSGSLLPPTGQVVEQEAAYVADALIQRLKQEKGLIRQPQPRKPFHYANRGRMLALGPGDGLLTLDFLPGPLKNLYLAGYWAYRFRDWYYDRKLRI